MDAKRQLRSSLSTALLEIPSGLIIGLVAVLLAISYAGVVFNGPMRTYLSLGIAALYTSSIIMIIAVNFFGSSKLIIAGPAPVFIVIASTMMAHLSASLQSMPSIDPLPTVMAALCSLGIISAASFYLMGCFNLGNMVRFIPYPVMCGFMAAIGWILLADGFTSLLGHHLSLANLLYPKNEPHLWIAFASLIYSATIVFILTKTSRPIVFFMLLAMAFLGFYCVLWIKGIALEQALKLNLMVGTKTSTFVNTLFHSNTWSQIQWHLLLKNTTQYISLLVVSPLAFLLKMSSFEIDSKKDIYINRDLKAAGTGGVVSAVIGGFIGYIDPVLTKLNTELSSKTRLAVMVVAAVYAFVLFSPIPVLNFIPRFVAGVVIFYLALNFLYHWLVKIRNTLSWQDYLIVIMIFLIIATVDLFIGVMIGLLITMLEFLRKYTKLSTVKKVYNGNELRSRVERNTSEKEILNNHGHEIFIVILQEFLFFGNTYSLYESIGVRLKNKDEPLKFLIIDYLMVRGIDSSAILGLKKIIFLATTGNFELIVTGITPNIKNLIKKSLDRSELEKINFRYSDLDHALEHAEDTILDEYKPSQKLAKLSELGKILMEIQKSTSLFSTQHFEGKQIIYNVNQPGDSFLYLQSGIVDIVLPLENNNELRIKSAHEGTIIGELGFFLNQNRNANFSTHTTCDLIKITAEDLKELEEKFPHLAIELYKQITMATCEKLKYTDNLLTSQVGL